MSDKTELPKAVLEKITQIQQSTKIPREEITKDYLDIYRDPFIQEDKQFTSDEERHRYAMAVLHTRYVSRPPVQDYQVIPVGFSSIRTSKTSGQTSASIFAIVKKPDTDMVFKRIVVRGREIEKLSQITPFAMYATKLGEFRGTDADLIADNRTKFDAPQQLKQTPEQVLGKINIKRLEIKECASFPSATREVSGQSYVIETDWRVVRGIITHSRIGKLEGGGQWGNYRISDNSVNDEPTVSPDGRVIPPGMAIWLNPLIMTYDVESECDFYGNIQLARKTGEAQMNCYTILPIHAKKVGAGGEQA